MAFIAAKCPACGGAIQLDDSKESGFCMYCGTKVLLQESIPQKVKVEGIQTLEGKLKNAETYAKLGEVDKAISLLTQVTEDFTSDYRAWWMLAKLKYAYAFYWENANPNLQNKIEQSKEFKYAQSLASESQLQSILNEYELYRQQIECNKEISKLNITATFNGDYQHINHAYNEDEGFEVMDGKLYRWLRYPGESYQSIQIEQVNPADLGIVSIFDGVIVIQPDLKLIVGTKTPAVLEKHSEFKVGQSTRKEQEDRIFSKLPIVIILIFIAILIIAVLLR